MSGMLYLGKEGRGVCVYGCLCVYSMCVSVCAWWAFVSVGRYVNVCICVCLG